MCPIDNQEPIEVAEEQSPAADLPILLVSKPSKKGTVFKGLLNKSRLYELGLPVIKAIKNIMEV